ncbi:MAG: transporter substrate-binding domain-containing protein [Janthinobacterium lividum]
MKRYAMQCLSLLSHAPKRLFAVLLLTATVGSAAVVSAAELPTLKVASDPTSQPFAFMDTKTKQMDGFDIELMREVGKLAGFKVEVLPLDFSSIIPALQSRSVDAAASSITITEPRRKVVDFSDGYYDSGLQILVVNANTSITKLDDLKGKRVGALTGATGYTYTQKELGSEVTLVPYPSHAAAALALNAGSVDAVVDDQSVLRHYESNGGAGKAKIVGPLYNGEKFGLGFVKGSPWVEPTNKALATLRANGTFAQLYTKWFGAPAAQ